MIALLFFRPVQAMGAVFDT
jgi:hypothetical protein